MKPQNLSVFILLIVIAASCSMPTHTFKSSNHDYQAGKNETVQPGSQPSMEVKAEWLTASVNNPKPIITLDFAMATETGVSDLAPSKKEQANLRKEIKNNIKEAVRHVKNMETKSVKAATAMDNDLKMAAIFGAVGIVLLGILWGDLLSLIGGVAIIIALVFLIRWLMRQ